MKRWRVYIAGPMRGKPKFNFPLFDKAERFLKKCGYDVVNPANFDRAITPNITHEDGFLEGSQEGCPSLNLPETMRRDLRELLDCDAIFLLPGSYESQGASLEWRVAIACGLTVLFASDVLEVLTI